MASFRPPIVARGSWEPGDAESPEQGQVYEFLTPLEDTAALRRRLGLARAIEGEVIPRLLLAHQEAEGGPEPSAGAGVRLDEGHVDELTGLVLTQDDETAWDYVCVLKSQGVPSEALFLELLAPAARRLGDLWVADRCDFAEVTVGLGRLQLILRRLAQAARAEVDGQRAGRRMLLSATPGEQHTFGILMVAEFMRRAGWDVAGEPGLSSADIVDLVAGEWFAVVGLSLHSERSVDALSSCIRAIRRASKNRAIGVMVGGKVFAENPELTPLVGADATASDGPEAAKRAERLIALLPMRC